MLAKEIPLSKECLVFIKFVISFAVTFCFLNVQLTASFYQHLVIQRRVRAVPCHYIFTKSSCPFSLLQVCNCS